MGQMEYPVLTVGYGSRQFDDVARLLLDNRVHYLVDVRSSPYSRYKQEFSREPLAAQLDRIGVRYVFMGQGLGGRPDAPECYDEEGRVDYDACRRRAAFVRDIERLERGWREGHRIAVMCSEGRPQDCHRTKLVAEELVSRGVPVSHIDADGDVIRHDEVMERIAEPQGTLFGPAAATRSRKQYRVA